MPEKNPPRINPGRRPGHNPDRNGADDGTGAIAASRTVLVAV